MHGLERGELKGTFEKRLVGDIFKKASLAILYAFCDEEED